MILNYSVLQDHLMYKEIYCSRFKAFRFSVHSKKGCNQADDKKTWYTLCEVREYKDASHWTISIVTVSYCWVCLCWNVSESTTYSLLDAMCKWGLIVWSQFENSLQQLSMEKQPLSSFAVCLSHPLFRKRATAENAHNHQIAKWTI